MSQHDVLILDAVINMLKLYADALNAIASVEEVSGKRADELLRKLLAPQNLAKLSQKLSPDVFGEFMSALLRLLQV
jgi:HJR/Mrr/RecB family endonuclease